MLQIIVFLWVFPFKGLSDFQVPFIEYSDTTKIKNTNINESLVPHPIQIYFEIEGPSPEPLPEVLIWTKANGTPLTKKTASVIQPYYIEQDFFAGMLPTISKAFRSQIPESSPQLFLSVRSGENIILPTLIAYPGDSLIIRWNSRENQLSFAGPQAAALEFQIFSIQMLHSIKFDQHQLLISMDKSSYLEKNDNQEKINQAKNLFGRYLLPIERGKEEILFIKNELKLKDFFSKVNLLSDLYSDDIPKERLNLFKSEIIALHYTRYATSLNKILPHLDRESLDNTLKPIYNRLLSIQNQFPEHYITAPNGLEFAYSMTVLEASLLGKETYEIIIEKHNPALAEAYFRKNLSQLKNPDSLISDWLKKTKDTPHFQSFMELYHLVKPGIPVNDATLLDVKGSPVSLSNMTGKYLLIDFWITGCGACLTFKQQTWDSLARYVESYPEILLISINADRSIERWKTNISKYSNDKVINLHAPGGSQHSLLSQFGISSYPSFLVVDKEGRMIQSSAFGRQLEDWVQIIQNLSHKTQK